MGPKKSDLDFAKDIGPFDKISLAIDTDDKWSKVSVKLNGHDITDSVSDVMFRMSPDGGEIGITLPLLGKAVRLRAEGTALEITDWKD